MFCAVADSVILEVFWDELCSDLAFCLGSGLVCSSGVVWSKWSGWLGGQRRLAAIVWVKEGAVVCYDVCWRLFCPVRCGKI